MRPALLAVPLVLATGAPVRAADDWREFRGPGGTGHADAASLPLEWSESRGVRWKTPVHGRGWSSPVVLGEQVWLTTATEDGTRLSALAFDRETGRVLFDEVIFEVAEPEDTRQYNSYASPTPVIEEGRVYLHWGSYGTASLDTSSFEVLWTRRDLECNHWRGPASSPILHGDLLIVHFDGYDHQYVVALDKRTGETVWRADRTHDFGTDDGDLMKGFATPIVIRAAGREQLISPAAKAVVSLDPATGRELWRVRYPEHSAATRPLFAHGLVYLSTGYGRAEMLAIRPDGRGDVTDTHVVWKAFKGIGRKPSPLVVDDLLYTVADSGGIVTCLDAVSGEEVWKGRAPGEGHSASPLYAAGRIYVFAEDGTAAALQPGRSFRILGTASVGEGGVMGTPAIAGDAIFLRTASHLYRIEERP